MVSGNVGGESEPPDAEESPAPIISVVLPSYRNPRSLETTLHQLSRQMVDDPTEVEIVVVDNNSGDSTREVVRAWIRSCPLPARYVSEPVLGVSHARNRGVNEAKGAYILFTDDDAELDPAWIAGYLRRIRESDPDALFSRISLIWAEGRPWWYSNRYDAFYGDLDMGDEPRRISDHSTPFVGKNFCVRRSVLLSHGCFDPTFGRLGRRLYAGEETRLYLRLVRAGRYILYFPDSPVGHRLKPSEHSPDYVRRVFRDGARSSFDAAQLVSRRQIRGRPVGFLLEACWDLLRSGIGGLVAALRREAAEAVYWRLIRSRGTESLRIWITRGRTRP